MKKYNLFAITSFLALSLSAQIKNAETNQFSVKGNCSDAKELIEKAGNQKKIASVVYDATTQTAEITVDKTKTNASEVLKKIALVGFDNTEYFAPNEAYAKLKKDCQYPRDKQMMPDHSGMNHSTHQQTNSSQESNQLSNVFEHYFKLKDAFVATNETEVKNQIAAFTKSIKAVEMGKLSHNVHMVWMEELNNLETNSASISTEKDIEKQRKLFSKVSESLYKLSKVAKLDYTVYYQNCPMFNGGSNWLSKEENIKNPYYGSKMLTCGSTVETLK